MTFNVNRAGTLEAVDGGASGKSAFFAKKKRVARIKPASKSVAQAGKVTLVIMASKAGKRTLRRKGKMSVPVHVTFRPVGGSPSVQTVRVKLRLKPHHSG